MKIESLEMKISLNKEEKELLKTSVGIVSRLCENSLRSGVLNEFLSDMGWCLSIRDAKPLYEFTDKLFELL